MELYVSYTEDGQSHHEQYSDEQYDYSWSYEGTFSVDSVSIEKPSGYDYETINVGWDAEPGQEVYVLTMIYGDGDSFGHASGRGEVLWIFKDIECAKKAAQKLREDENEYTVCIEDEQGEVIKLSNPGSGYFESVEDILVEAFIINKINSMRF